MTFTRFLGIGIATIIYGLCAVGWADVKPINPQTDCLAYVGASVIPSTALGNYKAYAQFINGQYVLCFNYSSPKTMIGTAQLQPAVGDTVVVYGLKLTKSSTAAEPMISISGSNVLLQGVQLSGPGSNATGSVGVALSGSGHAIINSTITGFATAVNVSGTNDGVQNSTLTGSANIIAGTIGVALSGSGHTMTANTITGFETGIQANCASPSPQPSPGGEGVANCTIGPKTVTDNVKFGVVVLTTGQGVTITQNEIRTIADPYANGPSQKIVLQGAANGGLTPPIFSIDPATMTIWKVLTDDKKFATEIGGVLPKNGTIELYEHHEELQASGNKTYKDYFRVSCPTAQNDKGQFEFKCTGLNIDAAKGQVFTNVTYTPNTSAMTKLIDVKDIPEKIYTAAVNPGATISGGSLSDPSSTPPAGDGGMVVGGAGETVAMNDGGLGGGGMSPPPDIKIDDASDGGSAAAMTGGAMVLAGDGAPSTGGGAASGCGGQLMPEKTPVDPTLFVILLMPIVVLLQVRWNKGG